MPPKLSQIEALSFDDVLLAPACSSVYSRKQVDTLSRLVDNTHIDTPIISANMDTVTEGEMLQAMHEVGAIGAVHRFMSFDKQLEILENASSYPVILTVGVGKETLNNIETAYKRLSLKHKLIVLIDVAHGHSARVINLIHAIRSSLVAADVSIIAGNVATYAGAFDLAIAGADSIKAGVGPGSLCSTRVVTGCGVPQLTAIMECARAINDSETVYKRRPTLIADGGIKTSGDIVKALAAGADTVMLGSLLSGTLETPGEVISIGDKQFKKFRGMASRAAQKTISVNRAPEGVEAIVPLKGSVKEIVNTLMEGVRSGMSYLNSHTISELHTNEIEFIRISAAGRHESHPHIREIAMSVEH